MDIWGQCPGRRGCKCKGPGLAGGEVLVRMSGQRGLWGWRGVGRAGGGAGEGREVTPGVKRDLLWRPTVCRALSQVLGTQQWESRPGSPSEPKGTWFRRSFVKVALLDPPDHLVQQFTPIWQVEKPSPEGTPCPSGRLRSQAPLLSGFRLGWPMGGPRICSGAKRREGPGVSLSLGPSC